MNGRVLLLALLLGLPTALVHGATSRALAQRVEQAVAEIRLLEQQYQTSLKPEMRAAALETLLARAAWLEQAGTLPEARDWQLKAVARQRVLASLRADRGDLELLPNPLPRRHGYVVQPDGAPLLHVALRPARAAELPPEWQPYQRRLWLLHVENQSQQPLAARAPTLFRANALGEDEEYAFLAADALPEPLAARRALFQPPTLLKPGEAAQWFGCLDERAGEPARVVFGFAWAGQPTTEKLQAVIPLVEHAHPQAFQQALKDAIREENLILQEQLKRFRAKQAELREELADHGVVAGPDPKGAQELPKDAAVRSLGKPVGKAERAGGAEQIQIRLSDEVRVKAGEVLLVYHGARYAGRIQLPFKLDGDLSKRVFLADIIQGTRTGLAEGNLYRLPEPK